MGEISILVKLSLSDSSSHLRNFFCAALSLTVEIILDPFPTDGDVYFALQDQNSEF